MSSIPDACWRFTLHEEGVVLGPGDVVLKDGRVTDSGGLTRFGVSSRAHPDLDIEHMDLAGAHAVYQQYWDSMCEVNGWDRLPLGMQLVTFDCAFNEGVPEAKAILALAPRSADDVLWARLAHYAHVNEAEWKYTHDWLIRILHNRVAAHALPS